MFENIIATAMRGYRDEIIKFIPFYNSHEYGHAGTAARESCVEWMKKHASTATDVMIENRLHQYVKQLENWKQAEREIGV